MTTFQEDWLEAERQALTARIGGDPSFINALLRRNRYKASMGLLSIATQLKSAGFSVEYVDHRLCLDLGIWDQVTDDIARYGLAVGVTCLTPNYHTAVKIIQELKTKQPNMFVLVGGPHCTYCYREALIDGADVVVHGEGEQAMLSIARLLSSGDRDVSNIDGVSFLRKDGNVVTTGVPAATSVSQVGRIDFSIVPEAKREEFEVYIFSSRGCPFNCSYCVEGTFWRNHRLRKIEGWAKRVLKAPSCVYQ